MSALLAAAGPTVGFHSPPDVIVVTVAIAYFVLFLPMVLVLVFLPQGLFGRVQL